MHRYLILALILLGHSGVGQECPAPRPPTPVVIHVTREEYPIASLKSRLISLLTDSLIDEGRGLVNVGRERQIQKLMKQLKKGSFYDPQGSHGNDGTDDARQKAPNSQIEMQRTAIR